MTTLTLDSTKQLIPGDYIYLCTKRYKVLGKPKLWKRSPNKVTVCVKYGLFTHVTVTEYNLHLFSKDNTI